MKMKKEIMIILGILALLLLTGCTQKTNKGTTNSNGVLQIGAQAPDASFTTIDGKTHKLSDYKGEKIMFWYFATWCSTCVKAAEALEKDNVKLQGMKIIALQTFGNAGYRGPTILEFAQKYSPKTLNYENWIWGDATQEGSHIYNVKNYPDIFYLIDENGVLQSVNGAPAAVMNEIISFAQE